MKKVGGRVKKQEGKKGGGAERKTGEGSGLLTLRLTLNDRANLPFSQFKMVSGIPRSHGGVVQEGTGKEGIQ
jgi:hypothetical protein